MNACVRSDCSLEWLLRSSSDWFIVERTRCISVGKGETDTADLQILCCVGIDTGQQRAVRSAESVIARLDCCARVSGAGCG